MPAPDSMEVDGYENPAVRVLLLEGGSQTHDLFRLGRFGVAPPNAAEPPNGGFLGGGGDS